MKTSQRSLEVSTALPADGEEALRFLEAHALEENAWLIWNVHDALATGVDDYTVMLCRDHGDVVGVMCVVRPDQPSIDLQADIDAASVEAVEALVSALPRGLAVRFVVFSTVVQQYLDTLPDTERWERDPFFTVCRETFKPVLGEPVAELTDGDAGLFEGCEQQAPHWESLSPETRVTGILRDGKVASKVCCTPITPKGSSSRRAISIGALYTETAYRRQGLAQRLVSCATEAILQQGDVPIYWTEPDNTASLSLCKGLGYRPYARQVRYLLRT